MTARSKIEKEVDDLLAEARETSATYGAYYYAGAVKKAFNEVVGIIDGLAGKQGAALDIKSEKSRAIQEACLLIAYREEDLKSTQDKEGIWDFGKIADKMVKVKNIITKGTAP